MKQLSKLENDVSPTPLSLDSLESSTVAIVGLTVDHIIVGNTLVRLIPRLESLAWLELGSTTMTSALVTDIQAHRTLRTVAFQRLPEPLPQSSVKKLLLHSATPNIYHDESENLAVIQGRNIRVGRFEISRDYPLWETMIHELDVRLSTDRTLEQVQAFIGHHSKLRKLIFRVDILQDLHRFSVLPQLSSFLDAADRQRFRSSMTSFTSIMTPIECSSKTGFE
ncbi:hypothetical protein C8J56DRAFT_536216 [Mycena floridula]|nr:hypothetical protein C8J56DRAFT_536216 [Mycena floridula]